MNRTSTVARVRRRIATVGCGRTSRDMIRVICTQSLALVNLSAHEGSPGSVHWYLYPFGLSDPAVDEMTISTGHDGLLLAKVAESATIAYGNAGPASLSPVGPPSHHVLVRPQYSPTVGDSSPRASR